MPSSHFAVPSVRLPARPIHPHPGRHALLLCLLTTVALLAPPATALAAASPDPVGRVSVVLGEVEAIDAAGTSRRLGRGDPVFEDDTLRSAPRGRAQLRFTDGGRLSLRPDTELRIDDHQFDEARPTAARQSLSLNRGGFRTRTGRIADANRAGYRVQTPLGVIGVRGTIFQAHQEPNGPLHLGASDGSIEIVSIAGITGRIGAGEDFDYLRVNPDGSIDFLIEAPDVFISTPDLAAASSGATRTPDLGIPADATLATGGGSAESVAGFGVDPGQQPVEFVNDPELRGMISRSESGTGAQPFVEPEPQPEPEPEPEPELQPALDPDLEALLLADNRIGVALGVPGADGDAGQGGLFGGIATVNAPVLALDTSTPGLATDLTTDPVSADRAALLAAADVILQSDSGVVDFEEDVAGVPGLVWGRYEAPLTLFLDPADDTQLLELDRDILFALGEPVGVDGLGEIAPTDGLLNYALTRFAAVSSGIAVTDMLGEGVLDLGSGSYSGFLDILLGGTDSMDELSLFVEFQSQVAGGVLQDLTLSADLFDFATETTSDADGAVAGFFTGNESGNEAAFLQLAFDLRANGRDDADVTGLALLEQLAPEPVLQGLSEADATALTEGFAWVGVSCCIDDGALTSAAVLGGIASDGRVDEARAALLGLQLDADGEPVAASDPAFGQFPPTQVIRADDSLATPATLDPEAPGTGSLAAFSLDRDALPVRAFDVQTGEVASEFGQSLLALTALPTSVADLTGGRRYELTQLVDGLALDEAGLMVPFAITDSTDPAAMSFNVDLGSGAVSDGNLLIPFEILEADGVDQFPTRSDVVARFDGQVATDGSGAFVDFVIRDGFARAIEQFADPVDTERSSLSGFFTGDDAEAFAIAFQLRSVGDNILSDAPDPLLVLGTATLGRRDLSLSMAEITDLDASGLRFVGATCCDRDSVFAGVATADARLLAFAVDADGARLGAGDAGFLTLAEGSRQVLRLGGSRITGPFDIGTDLAATDSRATTWGTFDSPVLRADGDSGDLVDAVGGPNADDVFGVGNDFQFLTATPSTLTALDTLGFATFSGSRSDFSITTRAESNTFNAFSPDTSMSFNVDLTTGEVFAGQMFVRDDSLSDFFGPDLGWELFFTGQVALSEDGSFVDFDLQDGSYDGRVPLDLAESRVEGFFAGEGVEDDFLFNGAFLLSSEADPDAEQQAASVGGVFVIGNTVRPELRLDATDVASWVRTDADGGTSPGLGIAAISLGFVEGFLPDRGVLLGRAGTAGAGEDYVLGANPRAIFDETGEELDDTRRLDFFAQPFEFVLRQRNAQEVLDQFVADARPEGAPSFEGFEVGWGAWQDVGSDTAASVQIDATDPNSRREANGRVHFASINPTPAAQIPRTGTFSYGGGPGSTAFVGSASGDLSNPAQFPTEIDGLSVAFDLDFGTGAISNGSLSTSYGVEPRVTWDATFDGVLNGAVTDLKLTGLEMSVFEDSFGSGDLDRSSLTGVLTGPNAERSAGGFSFIFDGPAQPPLQGEVLETVRGLWVIDRQVDATPL